MHQSDSLSENKLRVLVRKLVKAQEEERALISKDLHDSVGSSLVAVRFLMERIQKESGGRFCETNPCFGQAIRMIRDLAAETRRISDGLYPQMLETLGIKTALATFCDDFRKDYPNIALNCRIDLAEHKLPCSIKLVLYRLAQDGIDNIVRHSRANRVFLCIKNRDGPLVFELEDNGTGFDVNRVLDDDFLDDSAGLGLQRMTQQAESSGGRFEVFSKTGSGTRILAKWTLDT